METDLLEGHHVRFLAPEHLKQSLPPLLPGRSHVPGIDGGHAQVKGGVQGEPSLLLLLLPLPLPLLLLLFLPLFPPLFPNRNQRRSFLLFQLKILKNLRKRQGFFLTFASFLSNHLNFLILDCGIQSNLSLAFRTPICLFQKSRIFMNNTATSLSLSLSLSLSVLANRFPISAFCLKKPSQSRNFHLNPSLNPNRL